MCECYQAGGRHIGENPECYEHGRARKEREHDNAKAHRDVIISQLDTAISHGTPNEMFRAALNALEYLQSL